MNRQRFLAESVMVAGGLLFFAILCLTSVRRSLETQSERGQLRLQNTISRIVERAHKGKDDIAIQEAIYGLGEAPGILFAGIVGKKEEFLAHNQPALLGKPFHRSRLPLAVYPLHEGSNSWGTLVFALSDPSVRDGLVHQAVVCMIGALIVWSAWIIRYGLWNRHVTKLDGEKSDLLKQLTEREASLDKLEQYLHHLQGLWSSRLQEGLNRISQGHLFLDQNQRIAAINAPAASRLGIPIDKEALGKSWLDMPVLQSCGAAIEKSLATPGQIIEWPLKDNGCKLTFKTDATSGTWVSVSVE